jgi:hypothetical protein
MDKERICFVIAPIGDEGSEIRKRSDQVLKHVIKPGANECGYRATRADEISEPGLITSQVIQHVVEDPLVIADLTGRNPNVFYELALRHAVRKPLVQLIQKGETIAFDVAGMRTVPVDHHDLDSVEESRKEIVAQIKAVEKKKPEQVETPISVSLELQQLRQSDNPEQRTLADLLSTISELRTGLANLDKRLSSPEGVLPPTYIRMVARELGVGMRGSRMGPEAMMEIDALLRYLAESKAINRENKDYLRLTERIDRVRFMLARELRFLPDMPDEPSPK